MLDESAKPLMAHDGLPEYSQLDQPPQRRELMRNLVAFWICGLMNNYSYVVMLSAAQSIISGQAGAVLAADIVPTLIIKFTAPFWTHLFPYPVRVTVCTLFAIASFYTVAMGGSVGVRLLGVVFASISSGWGEATFLALAAFYDKSAITAWSSGTGFAGVAGAGWYVLVHKVLGASPRTTLILGGIFPIFYFIAFYFVLAPPRRPMKPKAAQVEEVVVMAESPGSQSSDSGVRARKLEVVSAQASDAAMGVTGSPVASPIPALDDGRRATSQMTWRERLARLPPLLPYAVPLALVYFAEYTVNQGTYGAIEFDDMSGFYEIASLGYQVGVFISRSSGTVLELPLLWPLPVLQFGMLAVFVGQALWHFVPSGWLMLLFVLAEGLLGGAAYVNAFRMLRADIEPAFQEFSLGAASVADTLGIVFAAITSMFLECALRRHNGIKTNHCPY